MSSDVRTPGNDGELKVYDNYMECIDSNDHVFCMRTYFIPGNSMTEESLQVEILMLNQKRPLLVRVKK